ncbi:MAG: ABC transporter substrate-binding protein [Mycobacteriaceae bacterium]|uniref:ABC transporter substrate-binding protein n=1 Tax=Corynebacterium sp. TaxID=1720 RepID=UPI003F9B9D52
MTPRTTARTTIRPLTALLSAGVLLFAASCGSGDDGGDSGEGDSGSDTRTVSHVAGETEVPVDPENVVSLWAPTLSAMFALDEPPQAYAHNTEPLEGIEYPEGVDIGELDHVGESTEPDLEKIANADPDLIIGSSVHEELFDDLDLIAPTVILEWDGTHAWKQHLTDVAEVLGAEDAATQVEDGYSARAGEVADSISATGTEPSDIETSVVRFHDEELRLEVQNSFTGMVVADVGLARPGKQDVEEEGSGYIPVSLENLTDADGDAMFAYSIAQSNQEGTDLLSEAEDSPLWGSLDAVGNDAVYTVDYDLWNAAGYIAAHGVLDDIEENLGD